MIERVVEDWLISINEKNFQVPFAQLLSSEGYMVVHIAHPHGPMEQGKDILALDPEGIPCAFQLKAENLSLKKWRCHEHPLKGQIEDLLDIPIDHPSITEKKPHRSFLVTTGILDETLRQTIAAFNRGREREKKSTLNVWVKDHLKKRMEKSLAQFLPQNLSSFRDFLRLYLSDGRGCPDKPKISSFLDQVNMLGEGKECRRPRQKASEMVIVGSYLVDCYQKAKNHISEIEVWTLVAAQLLRLATTSRSGHKQIRVSLSFIEVAIWKAMSRLLDEINERTTYVEGNAFSDVHVYRVRITCLMGMLSVVLFWDKWLNGQSTCDDVIRTFIKDNYSKMLVWGEGAVPSFLAAGWASDLLGINKYRVELAAAQIVRYISLLNNDHRRREEIQTHAAQSELLKAYPRGLPNPYISVHDLLKEQIELPHNMTRWKEDYIGESYSLEPLIHLLVRRLNRKLLETMWYEISHIAFATFRPELQRDLWRWHNISGVIEHKYTEHPTKWSTLKDMANKIDFSLMPPLAQNYPHFLLLFTIVAPHRLNSAIVTHLDKIDWEKGAWILG